VVAPRKLGFGSRLIEIVAAADLGGKVAWEYDPEGIKFTLTVPVDRLNP
jgi:two-component sensor histidine kinase